MQLWDWLLATDESTPGGDVAAADLTKARQSAAAAAAVANRSNATGAFSQIRLEGGGGGSRWLQQTQQCSYQKIMLQHGGAGDIDWLGCDVAAADLTGAQHMAAASSNQQKR